MRSALAFLLVAAIAVTPSSASAEKPVTGMGEADRPGLPHAADHVLVKLEPGVGIAEAAPGATAVFDHWVRLPVPPGEAPIDIAHRALSRPGVEAAELDYVVQLEPQVGVDPAGELGSSSVNDPYVGFQWHFPKIEVEKAWNEGTGAGSIVAVVDTGISQEGADLGCHSFVYPFNAIDGITGPKAANDDHGHGTHVAGTIAQCTNNGVGVAGVAHGTSLMPIKALDSSGTGLFSWVAAGIDWATSQGADVLNLSLGCQCSSSIVSDAIQAAVEAGVVVVASSGNNGADIVSFPANLPGVIAVGAVDYNGERAPYSNGGPALDLVAPGGDATKDANGDGYADGVLQETFVWKDERKDFGYRFFQGTSMAAPHVSGAIALLLSAAPGASPIEVVEALVNTATDLGQSGYDTDYGHGLIQVLDAADYLIPPKWSEDADVTVERYGETELTLAWTGANDNVGVTRYRVIVGQDHVTTASGTKVTITGLDPGSVHAIGIEAGDSAGHWSQAMSASFRTARRFSDTKGTTFYKDILWMSAMDITRGCNPPTNDMFCPEDPVTRATMAAFMVRALGLKENTHPGFADVPRGSLFAEDIGRLATAGITRGCNPPENDMFCPDDPVTRETMAAFLVRALGLNHDTHPGFVDVPGGSLFAEDIGRLATAGVTRGCNPPENDRFCPGDVVTRGQLAAFLNRGLG